MFRRTFFDARIGPIIRAWNALFISSSVPTLGALHSKKWIFHGEEPSLTFYNCLDVLSALVAPQSQITHRSQLGSTISISQFLKQTQQHSCRLRVANWVPREFSESQRFLSFCSNSRRFPILSPISELRRQSHTNSNSDNSEVAVRMHTTN